MVLSDELAAKEYDVNFELESLELQGVSIIRARRFEDNRGYFMETWSRAVFKALGIESDFVQDNESLSTAVATVRGLHFQKAPFEQAKLVRVLRGTVFDVVVDIRPGSPTFSRWCAATLTSDRGEQLFVPRGFAHGFATMEPNTIVTYKVDAPYSPEHEAGVLWGDPAINIRWPFRTDEITLSDRDKNLPVLRLV